MTEQECTKASWNHCCPYTNLSFGYGPEIAGLTLKDTVSRCTVLKGLRRTNQGRGRHESNFELIPGQWANERHNVAVFQWKLFLTQLLPTQYANKGECSWSWKTKCTGELLSYNPVLCSMSAFHKKRCSGWGCSCETPIYLLLALTLKDF